VGVPVTVHESPRAGLRRARRQLVTSARNYITSRTLRSSPDIRFHGCLQILYEAKSMCL
jgi:hypothetical protein